MKKKTKLKKVKLFNKFFKGIIIKNLDKNFFNKNKFLSKNSEYLLKYKISFKNNFFFLKKLFMILLKKGNKNRVINLFILFINIIKLKIIKKKLKSFIVNFYIKTIIKNITPIINYSLFTKKGKSNILPKFKKLKKKSKQKMICMSLSWIKSSLKFRKEKTVFLKLLSELEDIRFKKGYSVDLKKEFYKNFISNKFFKRLIKNKKLKWI